MRRVARRHRHINERGENTTHPHFRRGLRPEHRQTGRMGRRTAAGERHATRRQHRHEEGDRGGQTRTRHKTMRRTDEIRHRARWPTVACVKRSNASRRRKWGPCGRAHDTAINESAVAAPAGSRRGTVAAPVAAAAARTGLATGAPRGTRLPPQRRATWAERRGAVGAPRPSAART